MATYREIAYMVLDELKALSGDSTYTEEHVVFLADKYRAYAIEQKYLNLKYLNLKVTLLKLGMRRREVPASLFQMLCLDLETATDMGGGACGVPYLRTTVAVPDVLPVAQVEIYPSDFLSGAELIVTNVERMPFVGLNTMLRNFIYCCIGPDKRIWLKSSNPQMAHLKSIRVNAVFQEASKAAELQCDECGCTDYCDVLDKDFPCEDSLITTVITGVVSELGGRIYLPADKKNDSDDTMSSMYDINAAGSAKGGAQ